MCINFFENVFDFDSRFCLNVFNIVGMCCVCNEFNGFYGFMRKFGCVGL